MIRISPSSGFLIVCSLLLFPMDGYGQNPGAEVTVVEEDVLEINAQEDLQDELESIDLTPIVAELENKVAVLERELALLKERLEALLGVEPDYRIHTLPIGNSPVLGNFEAAVTLVMFGDYQSNYTARAQYVIKRLLENYPDDLQFVYKHYPLSDIHPQANNAALTALAAERQGVFWEMHEQLFLNSRRLDPNLFLVLAGQAGMDLNQFEDDRQSLWALTRLTNDEKLAVSVGVTGLPTLFLNGRRMPTWRYDYLESQIEKRLPSETIDSVQPDFR